VTQRTPESYFWIRRLHSLTGLVPIGAFVLVHLFTNAYSWMPKAFNEHVKALNETPFVWLIEYAGIMAPIAFHAFLGLWMCVRMDVNQTQYGNFRNWMYFLQRLSGVIVFAFIVFHLAQFRFLKEDAFKHVHLPIAAKPGVATPGYPEYDPYGTIRDGLRGNVLGVPIYVLYYVGVLATAFHFANGLWSFCVTWGITVGRRSQLLMSYLTMAIFLGVSFFGIYALTGFLTVAAHN
jgi:succinate dehydrogenase / fumarate reductase cytochrome b subunit